MFGVSVEGEWRGRGSGLRRWFDRQGFSLIETLLVIVLLAIIGGAALLPLIHSLRGSADPLLMQQAVFLAQERLEQVVADRRDNVTPRGYAYATDPANYPAEGPVAGYPNFGRSVEIACVAAADLNGPGSAPAPSCVGISNYARVTVRVTNGEIGEVSVATLITNY